jgi:hypothetical protein
MIMEVDLGDQVCQETSNLAECEGDEAISIGLAVLFAELSSTAVRPIRPGSCSVKFASQWID